MWCDTGGSVWMSNLWHCCSFRIVPLFRLHSGVGSLEWMWFESHKLIQRSKREYFYTLWSNHNWQDVKIFLSHRNFFPFPVSFTPGDLLFFHSSMDTLSALTASCNYWSLGLVLLIFVYFKFYWIEVGFAMAFGTRNFYVLISVKCLFDLFSVKILFWVEHLKMF